MKRPVLSFPAHYFNGAPRYRARGRPRRISKAPTSRRDKIWAFALFRQDRNRPALSRLTLSATSERTPLSGRRVSYAKRVFITFCGVAGQTEAAFWRKRRNAAVRADEGVYRTVARGIGVRESFAFDGNIPEILRQGNPG